MVVVWVVELVLVKLVIEPYATSDVPYLQVAVSLVVTPNVV